MSSPAGTYGGFMYLENLVVDAVEPQLLGRFWETVLGAEQLADVPSSRTACSGCWLPGDRVDPSSLSGALLCAQMLRSPSPARPPWRASMVGFDSTPLELAPDCDPQLATQPELAIQVRRGPSPTAALVRDKRTQLLRDVSPWWC